MRMLVLLAISLRVSGNAETLDAIAVSVGKHVITVSEVVDYVRISAFLDGGDPDFSPSAKRTAAGRLVDRYLILQDAEFTRSALPGDAAVGTVLDPLKAKYANSDEWKTALDGAQISEESLRAHLLAGLRLLRYTDARFRPEVQITEENLRAYYNSVIARAAQKEDKPPSFEDSRDQVERLLTAQLTTQALDRWLEMTRKEAQAVYREAAFK